MKEIEPIATPVANAELDLDVEEEVDFPLEEWDRFPGRDRAEVELTELFHH